MYASLDLRVAQHPSETLEHLLLRVIGYAVNYEEGLAFGRGISTADEPAAWVKRPDGTIALWLDVGTPSAERLHKASKASLRVVVMTRTPELTLREARSRPVHAPERVTILSVETALLAALSRLVERHNEMTVLLTGGRLYVTLAGQTIEGGLTSHALS